ncbi:MAG: carbohydrate ABC transporter permease [Clostridia bacterium]|jgi:multiple sugar transport system permease protein
MSFFKRTKTQQQIDLELAMQAAKIHEISGWQKLKHASTWKHIIFRFFTYILLFSMAFVFLYPFLFLLTDSVKSLADLTDITVKWIPTRGLRWANYKYAWQELRGPVTLPNSLYMTAVATLIHVISCSFIGYGFARFHFKGSNLLFGILVLAMVIPLQVMMIPSFILYSNVFGWTNSMKPILIPCIFGYGLKGGLYIFIFRQFFINLPKELEEAAYIDGCGFIQTHFRIILPISKSSILVVSILSMVFHWNDYTEPNMYLTNPKIRIFPQGLPGLYRMAVQMVDDLGYVIDKSIYNQATASAGAVLSLLPILVVYLVAQKQFVEGIQHTGAKQ